MPSRDLSLLTPNLTRAYLQAAAEYAKRYPDLPQPFITCTHRSYKEQEELYAIGRTKPGRKVTNAKPGMSKHNFIPSKAFDIAFISLTRKLDWNKELFTKFYQILHEIDKSVVWGGKWKFTDYPHFEEGIFL